MASRRGVSVLCQALMQRASASCPAGGMLAASKALSASSAWAVVSAPASAVGAARALWTSAPALSANLLKALKDEVDYEQTNYRKPDEIAAGPPSPFTLTEEPGDTLLTLTRKYKDEDIAVNLQVNNQAPSDEGDGENEDGESLNIVVFNVSVTKGSRSLVFECESDGTYVGITHLSAEPKDGFDSDSMYTGPVFEELDDTLQRHWKTYLEERGVVPELGEYLRHLVYDKEQREYVAWLQGVHDFLAK